MAMDRNEHGEALVNVAAALAAAMVLAPFARAITVDLDNTLGRAWPFSISRCHVRATPGCAFGEFEAGASATAEPRRQASR